MNIDRAKQEIKNTIEAYLLKDSYGNYEIPSIRQRPVLLIGPPGVGKTQIMEQISRECGIGLVSYTITHHTRQSAVGLPYIKEKLYSGKMYSVTEYTMSEIVASIYDKMEETGLNQGILFIDEINCVSETLAPAMLQFLQCKTFGSHKIPEGWIIAAAGNPPEFNKSVREFDIVTLDRIKMIPVEADFDAWKEYAYKNSIHPAVISYLNIKKQYFCQIETTVEGKAFATPRGWEDLSCLIGVYEKTGKKPDRDVIYQYIQHRKIAKDFANYLELFYKYKSDYQVEEILNGVIRENMCTKISRAPFDEKISVIDLLIAGLNGQFKDYLQKEMFVGELMGQLKLFMGEEYEAVNDASEIINNIIKEYNDTWETKNKAKLLSREENYRCQDIVEVLEHCREEIKEAGVKDRETAWNIIRELFNNEKEAYEDIFETGKKMLENAFNFIEAAFGDSQEMVMFVTQLNTGCYSVGFLQQYECERYYQYNKRLLFEENEGDILDRINKQGGN